MSGGTFEYSQYHIEQIIDSIEERLERQGKEIPKEKQYYSSEDEQQTYETYPENVQLVMREGLHQLKRAYIFTQCIDRYLAGDDSEETMYEELSIELAKLENPLTPDK